MSEWFSRKGMNAGFNLVFGEPKKIIDGLGVLKNQDYMEEKELIEKANLDKNYIEKMLKMRLIGGKSEGDKKFYKMLPAGADLYSMYMPKRWLI